MVHSQLVSIARSQLAKNKILMNLAAIYGTFTFTSSDASKALHLNMQYLSKVLYRLRKNYLVQVVAKTPRPGGGYRCVYQVSSKGWKRIRHVQNGQKPTRSLIQQTAGISYLLNGQGNMEDFHLTTLLKQPAIVNGLPSSMDEIGHLLYSLDHRFFTVELGRQIVLNSRLDGEIKSWLTTTMRAQGLQTLGYLPKDLPLTTFIPNAVSRGTSESTILLGLALRRTSEQQKQIEEFKQKENQLNRAKETTEPHLEREIADLRHAHLYAELKSAKESNLVIDNNRFLLDLSDTLDILNETDLIVMLAKSREKIDPQEFRFRAGLSDPAVVYTQIEGVLQKIAKQDILIDHFLRRIETESETYLKLKQIILQKVLSNIETRDRINCGYS